MAVFNFLAQVLAYVALGAMVAIGFINLIFPSTCQKDDEINEAVAEKK